MTYRIVFDARHAGIPGWEAVIIGLVFIVIGYAKRTTPPPGARAPALAWLFGHAILVLACVWTAVAAVVVFGSSLTLRQALDQGNFIAVEGVVTDFVPGDAGDHTDESWHVTSGHQEFAYHYSPAKITAGFRQTQPHGGPIRNGLHVRIADVDGQIAHLEIAPEDSTSRAPAR